jgi:hypothetical protein
MESWVEEAPTAVAREQAATGARESDPEAVEAEAETKARREH